MGFAMATIKIDDKEYEMDDLSQEVKAQIASLRYVEGELAKLNMKLAALQTAKLAYARALKASLENEATDNEEISIEGLGDTLSFD